MKAGGNAKFRQFLESQEDYDPCWSLQDKYNSKAAALFRDKVRPRAVPRLLPRGVSGSSPRTEEYVAPVCPPAPGEAGNLWLVGGRMGLSPPHWETGVHLPLSILVKILLKTAVPAGGQRWSWAFGVAAPDRELACTTAETWSQCSHEAETPPLAAEPGGSLEPAPSTAALTGLGSLNPCPLGRWPLWPKAENGLWSHHLHRTGPRHSPSC